MLLMNSFLYFSWQTHISVIKPRVCNLSVADWNRSLFFGRCRAAQGNLLCKACIIWERTFGRGSENHASLQDGILACDAFNSFYYLFIRVFNFSFESSSYHIQENTKIFHYSNNSNFNNNPKCTYLGSSICMQIFWKNSRKKYIWLKNSEIVFNKSQIVNSNCLQFFLTVYNENNPPFLHI